jgi:hypothetical protein
MLSVNYCVVDQLLNVRPYNFAIVPVYKEQRVIEELYIRDVHVLRGIAPEHLLRARRGVYFINIVGGKECHRVVVIRQVVRRKIRSSCAVCRNRARGTEWMSPRRPRVLPMPSRWMKPLWTSPHQWRWTSQPASARCRTRT